MSNKECQIHCFPEMAETIAAIDVLWQRRNRVKRLIKRRWNYLMNLFNECAEEKTRQAIIHKSQSRDGFLKAGDKVRVRSREEIRETLDRWNQLKKCSFMEEMWPYCGTTQQVFKRVENFLDERDYLIKKCSGVYILEGVFCEGTNDFGPCDRSCFLFWREEWLEKLSKS